jgi:hypothetical protein
MNTCNHADSIPCPSSRFLVRYSGKRDILNSMHRMRYYRSLVKGQWPQNPTNEKVQWCTPVCMSACVRLRSIADVTSTVTWYKNGGQVWTPYVVSTDVAGAASVFVAEYVRTLASNESTDPSNQSYTYLHLSSPTY